MIYARTINKLVAALLALLIFAPANAVTTTYFFEDFSDNTAGWSLELEWQIGPATASAPAAIGYFGDPGSDHTPTADNGVAGVVIGGNANIFLHDYFYMTSPIVDVSGETNLTLEFYRWLNSDYSPFMQNSVEVFDGAAWNVVWQSGSAPGINDNSWIQQSFDVSAYINPAFAVRFGHRVGSSGVFTVSSWNVDDVSFYSTTVPLPAGAWLLGSALGLLGWIKRRAG